MVNKLYLGVPAEILPTGMYERLLNQESDAMTWFANNLLSLLKKQKVK